MTRLSVLPFLAAAGCSLLVADCASAREPAYASYQPAAWSPDEGAVFVTVTDDRSGQPIPGATVLIPALRLGSATNRSGEAMFVNVPPGSAIFHAPPYVGFEAWEREVTVHKGVITGVEIALTPAPLESLQDKDRSR